jgi:aerobic-type carbon monoxide dehydrogenase small subunit (CoxS/CutS family)
MSGFRITQGIERGEVIQFSWNGQPVVAYAGETIAAALMVAGHRGLRQTPQGAPRGLYCGMGVCWECSVSVDGRPNIRACMTLVAPGMQVGPSGESEQCRTLTSR